MQRWLRLNIIPEPERDKKNILILDSFRGHLTEEIGQACKDTGTLRCVIPGGYTSKLQPLDLKVNRSFKSRLRKIYQKKSREALGETGTSKISTQRERLNLLTQSVREAWFPLNKNVIQNGFKVMMRNLRQRARDNSK